MFVHVQVCTKFVCEGKSDGVSLVSLFDPLFKRFRSNCLDVCLTWYLLHIKTTKWDVVERYEMRLREFCQWMNWSLGLIQPNKGFCVKTFSCTWPIISNPDPRAIPSDSPPHHTIQNQSLRHWQFESESMSTAAAPTSTHLVSETL